MLVLSMNSKRQRRPNVRLGEIGDVSAAFACGVSQKSFVHKRWKPDILNSQEDELDAVVEFYKGNSPGFFISDPGVSPRLSADSQHNGENKNPNSLKSGFDSVHADVIDMMKSGLSFGTVTRKSRVMKRRARSREGNDCRFDSAWTRNSKLSPRFTGEERKEDGFAYANCSPVNVFRGVSDHEATVTSNDDACEYDVDEPGFNSWQLGNTDDCWKDAYYEGNNEFLKSVDAWDQSRYPYNDVTSVRGWLEDLGFGRYAGIFEMHEVDEESLPLLTLDDLKEMGIFAVGHRRKLYNAILQLRGDASS